MLLLLHAAIGLHKYVLQRKGYDKALQLRGQSIQSLDRSHLAVFLHTSMSCQVLCFRLCCNRRMTEADTARKGTFLSMILQL